MKIDKLMIKIKEAHCSFWGAFFSLGITCILGNSEAAELKKVQDTFRAEFAISENMYKQMGYFGSLQKIAK